MNKQNTGLSLSRLLAQVVAIQKVIGSEVLEKLKTHIPALGGVHIIREVMRAAEQNLGFRSHGVEEGIRNVMGYAMDEAARLEQSLIAAGAEVSSVPEVEVDTSTLRSVDHLLAPAFTPGSVRLNQGDVKVVQFFVSTFALSQALEALYRIIGIYRFEVGDYDKSILAERLFCEAAGLLLPLVTNYHCDLLLIDRDSIRRLVESEVNPEHPELLICAKGDGLGTWSSPFNSMTGGVKECAQAFIHAPLVICVSRSGTRVISRAEQAA